MKLQLLIIGSLLAATAHAQQRVSDGTVSAPINPDAILDLQSNQRGLLLPRVGLTDTALAAPLTAHVKGMVVYDTATHVSTGITPGVYYNDGIRWIKVNNNVAWQLGGNKGTAAGANGVGSAVDGSYVGTADQQNLVVATNGIKRMIVDTAGNAVGGTGTYLNLTTQYYGYPSGNFIWGTNDTVNSDGGSVNGYNNVVFGFLNKSTAANSSIFGINNKDLNNVLDEGYNFISGNDNMITDVSGAGASTNMVLGSRNTITSASSNIVLGEANTVNSVHHHSMAAGLQNTINSDTAYAIGFNNTVNHYRSFAIGNGAVTTAQNQFSANFSGGYHLIGIGTGAAGDSIVTDSVGYIRHRSTAAVLHNAWSINGNTGTNSGINFIGTTDTANLVFKVGGVQAGYLGGGDGDGDGSNTAYGLNALMSVVKNTAANTGVGNLAVGTNAQMNTVNGSYNESFGHGTLQNNVSGSRNLAFGWAALENNNTGSDNMGFGLNALDQNNSGNQNIALGHSSLYYNTSGSDNIAIGYGGSAGGGSPAALGNNTTGSNNIGIGYETGLTNNTGNNNILIGTSADVAADGLTNATAIGNNAIVGESNAIVLGGTGSDAVNIGIGTTTPNSTLQVNGSVSAPITTGTTLGDADYTVLATGNITIPAPSASNTGRIYNLIYESGSVTVSGTMKLGGAAVSTYTLNGTTAPGITIQSSGTAWIIINRL